MKTEDVEAVLAGRSWVFAKTMPQWPHWYTLRRTWDDDAAFDGAVQAIRDLGQSSHFGRKTFIYLSVDGGRQRVWTMGSPADQTILINRAYQWRIRTAAIEEYRPYMDDVLRHGLTLRPDAEYYAATTDNGALIGLAGVVWPIQSKTAIFKGDYVPPEWRGRGAWLSLFVHRVVQCHVRGVERVRATATKMSYPLYRRMGFADVQYHANGLIAVGGSVHDVMRRIAEWNG